MFERLDICNFQAHEALSIDFDPFITTIVGQTDAGKSAIIRALVWIATNKPAGDSFIRHGSDETTVILAVDGHTLARTRGGENSYTVDGKTLKAFGADVPAEITNVLKLGAVNFQFQYDSPFWFSESAGEVSRRLNAVINLGVIDRTLAYFHAAIKDHERFTTTVRERLSIVRKRKMQLKPVDRQDTALRQVERIYSRLETKRHKVDMASRWVQDVSKVDLALKRFATAASCSSVAVSKGEKWARMKGRADQLHSLITKTKELDRAAVQFAASAEFREAEFKKEMGDVCQLCGTKLIR